ncbi:MAG: type II toxin-antitoxin system MqsR family toxin [Ruminiclostridium sp.]|nr:type II toxin-antitoxin system MqsR family toxin [Ruminiclostridium sp.]
MGQDVNDFLAKCCLLIDERYVDPFTQNLETKDTLNLLGYSIKAMLQEIKELGEADLIKDPEPDKDSKYPGDVWIFIKKVQTYNIYIKLKIRELKNGDKQLFIMSFHPARY